MSTLDFDVPASADPSLRHDCHWAWALESAASEPLATHVLAGFDDFPSRQPRTNELFLWFGTPRPSALAGLLAALGAAERADALRHRHEADRLSFAATRVGLRTLLARATGCEPREVAFVRGEHGKPALRERSKDAPYFSASRTRGLVAIAIAAHRVGVDIEQRRQSFLDRDATARIVFSPEAIVALAEATNDRARERLFYRFWTLGEAFVKATGDGIALGLKTFAFTSRGAPALTRVHERWGPPERWRFGVS